MTASVEPLTPVLQMAAMWGDCLATTPPSIAAPLPPKAKQQVLRKPAPSLTINGVSPELLFKYPLTERSLDRPVDPLRFSSKASSARQTLTVEREYVQCMVCRTSSIASSAAELVCSHYVHPRCLQQFVASKAKEQDRDEYPPCEICKYPAKPKDSLLNQSIRALVRPPASGVQRPVTPPPRTPRRSDPSLELSPASSNGLSNRLSTASSIYSIEHGFKPFDTKVPLRLSVTPVSKTHSIGDANQECKFLVSVACPDYTYTATPHVSTPQDLMYSHKIKERLSHQIGLPTSEIGRLRMERTIEFSAEGLIWVPGRIYLFEFIVVVLAPGSTTPLMLADIEQSLTGISLVTCTGVSMGVQFNFVNAEQPPAYITSGNRDQLFSLVSAINDSSLQFPLAKPDHQLLLQSPFGSDYVFSPPCHTVVCLPDSLPLSVISEAVGRMRTFEKIGVVRYGRTITSFALERQSFAGWEERLHTPPNFSSGSQPLKDIIAAAEFLFDNSSSSNSILLISQGQSEFEGTLPENVPVYTIGVGNHNPSVLSRISSRSCGAYLSSPTDQLAQYITHLAFAERTLSHQNVSVTLKQHQSSIASISGFGYAPGDNSNSIDENCLGHMTVSVGRLRAGQKQSFVVGLELDDNVFKYAVEGAEAKVLEVAATARMVPGGTFVNERVIARTGLAFDDCISTASYGSRMHTGSPICAKDNIYSVYDRVALSTAVSLDVLIEHLENFELGKAAGVAQAIEQRLQDTTAELTKITTDTKLAAGVFLDVNILVDVLLAESRHLHVNIGKKHALSNAFQISWLLRSRRAFSRRTSLEAIYFDDNLMNVV